MNGFTRSNSEIYCFNIGWVGKEIAVTDGYVDAGKALVNHPPRAQRCMAYFTVTHLPIGHAYGHTCGVNETFRAFTPRLFPSRSKCRVNSIVCGFFRVAKAIEN